MDKNTKITTVKALLNDSNIADSTIKTYLDLAEDKIVSRCYPFGGYDGLFPDQYSMLQCELATRLIARMGAEGEKSHTENGIIRNYANVNDSDLLDRVVQVLKV